LAISEDPIGGFPPIDRLYYENPGVVLGGWIGRIAPYLQGFELGNPRLNLVPGESGYVRTPCRHFDSLQDLQQHLKEDHQLGHFYRGQTARYRVTYRDRVETLAQAFPNLSTLTVRIESLVASTLRNVVASEVADWKGHSYPRLLDMIRPVIRAIAHSDHEPLRELLRDAFEDLKIIAVEHLLVRLGADPRRGVVVERAPLTNVATNLLQLISLSQHYEFGSVMIDVTRDPEIAVWFASHRWSGNPVDNSEDVGVVYRFSNEEDKLSRALNLRLQEEGGGGTQISAAAPFGLVTIDEMPEHLGLRPRRQAGGSFLGLENSILHLILDMHQCLDVFTFPLKTVSSCETKLRKEDLCPEDDPALRVFRSQYMRDDSPLTCEELDVLAENLAVSEHTRGVLQRGKIQGLV